MRGMLKSSAALALAAASMIGAAQAQSVEADADNWFASRVREVEAAERPDFKPNDAGYVRLSVEIRDAQRAALCPSDRQDLSRLRGTSSGLFRDFLASKSAWGVAAKITYTPTASSDAAAAAAASAGPTTLEHNVFSVEKFGDAKSCQPLSDNSDLLTPLLRADVGMAPISFGVSSWLTRQANQGRLDAIRGWSALAAGLVGAPAAMVQPLLLGAQTTFTNRIDANVKMGHSDAFELGRPDAGKTLLVYLGRNAPASIATWTPGPDDPYAEIKLVSIGSVFDPSSPTYPNLSSRTSSDVLDRTRLADRSVRDHLRGDAYDKLLRATTVEALDAACVDLRRSVGGKTGFSPADEALAIYHLALEHETLGGKNLSGDALAEAPFLKARCVRNLQPDLKKLGVTLPEKPPLRVAPTSDQMKDALQDFVNVLRADDAEGAGRAARASFAAKLTLQDGDGALGAEEVSQLEGASAIGATLNARFGRAGCWLPYPEQAGAPWPAGFGRDKSWVRVAAAIATPKGSETPLLVRFEFDSEAAGGIGRISRIDVRTRFFQTIDAFRTTFPNGCAAGSLKPEAVFGAPATP